MKDNTKNTIVDQAMYCKANSSWSPTHFLDFAYSWDAKYVKQYKQLFSPFVFAKNCSALASTSCDKEIIKKQAVILDMVAQANIFKINPESDHLIVLNNFVKPHLYTNLCEPFFGCFMNGYTAYGYVKLFEATDNQYYLDIALRMFSAYLGESPSNIYRLPLKEHGQNFLYEYIWICMPWEEEYWRQLSFPIWNVNSSIKLVGQNVFNGHCHALIAAFSLEPFKSSIRATNVFTNAAEILDSSVSLLRNWWNGAYFSYSLGAPLIPDYGQRRAVELIEAISMLSNLSSCTDLKNEFSCFFSQKSLKDFVPETLEYRDAMNSTRHRYKSLLKQSVSHFADIHGQLFCFAFQFNSFVYVNGLYVDDFLKNKSTHQTEFACYLLTGDKALQKKFYQKSTFFKFASDASDGLRVRFYCRKPCSDVLLTVEKDIHPFSYE